MPRPATGTVIFKGGRWLARLSLGDGRRKLVPLPTWFTEEQAREKARELTLAIRMHGVEETEAAAVPETETCAQWWGRYFKWREGRGQSSVKDARGRVNKWVLPELDMEIRAVRRGDLERLVRKLDRAVIDGHISAKTAGNVWGEVTSAFGQAQKSKSPSLRVREDDPTRDVLGPDSDVDKSKPILFPDEVTKLLSCERVPHRRRRMYAVAIYTAARSNELAALTAADVDLDHHRITIAKQVDRKTGGDRRTKTRRSRTIDIEAELFPLIVALVRERPEGRLLHMPPIEDRAELLRADLRTAGVTRAELFIESDPQRLPIWFHHLRDTGLTWMAIRGDDPLRIQWRGGHTDFKMTQRYISQGKNFAHGFGAPFPSLPSALFAGGVLASVLAPRSNEAPESAWNPEALVVTPTGLEDVQAREQAVIPVVSRMVGARETTSENVSAPSSATPSALSAAIAEGVAALLRAGDIEGAQRLLVAMRQATAGGAGGAAANVVDIGAARGKRGAK